MNKEKSKILHSDGERNTKGVTIIVKEELEHKLEKKNSKRGNYVIISFEHNNETHNLIALYLEPEDYSTMTLKCIIQEADTWIKRKDDVIILGDLNCIE